ncbi:MarR family transcriptional regulator [Streptomyces sp. TRM66268-LWL]|uniref:MarR family transcriptional regulator n=1 Tax=Streptomyces polyasparticus TaxID=2767826 RepID=A0ABR7SRW6_9ACTN|nr:MarR family transcriptional regulator [Streptomyces polyasparticus]MBC9717400.1 MarR family transcriptional regulator [Streptomyces polyasparticus]
MNALARALACCEGDSFTGVVRVSGRPGGVLRLRHGRVVSARSPGAPDLETLLLRSGRVARQDWPPAVPEERRLGRLVGQGVIGAGELRGLGMLALRDAAFAMAAGEVDGWAAALGAPQAEPDPVGAEECPTALVREAARRLAALERLPGAVAPYREALLADPGATGAEAVRTGAGREILALADGRLTARDIAFRTGRGLYAITVEASRLLAQGLLVRVPPPACAPRSHGSDATASLSRRRTQAEPVAARVREAEALPRRSPGISGRTAHLGERNSTVCWQGIVLRAGKIVAAGKDVADEEIDVRRGGTESRTEPNESRPEQNDRNSQSDK